MHKKCQQKTCLLIFVFVLLPVVAQAQIRDWPDEEREDIKINYTEANVSSYTLPDLLTLLDGQKVADTQIWKKRRRPEIMRLLVQNQFGRTVGNTRDVSFTVFDQGTSVFEGRALRKQVTIHFGKGPEADLLIYLPANSEKPSPLLFNISILANCQTVNDVGVKEGEIWNGEQKRVRAGKGSPFPKIDVMQFIERGYGFATIYYGDIEPDFKEGLPYGIRSQYLKSGQALPAPDEWGAIAAWAWGLSRAMDYFEADSGIDAGRVAITGVSRLGKTALWAAASDPRFAMAIPSCSGQGGAALSRRNYGETIKLITLPQRYGYQFCENYAKWGDTPNKAPMDAHMIIALMAPRPVLLQTGDADKWSDPMGEFKAAEAAEPVYELFGKKGLGTERIPPSGTPILHDIGYYMHKGGHGMFAADGSSDWNVYLDFMDMHLKP
jgi:hypothetical protein